jgi:kelch-like protein 18
MPTQRNRLAAVSINGFLYALGGQLDGSTIYSTVEAYDPITDTWTTKAPMTIARQLEGVGVLNDQIYAAGGQNNSSGPLATAEAYNPRTDTWTAIAPMSTARYGLTLGVNDGVLYAIGGTTDDLGAFSIVEAFTPVVGPPINKIECKNGGWQTFNTPRTFESQAHCIKFVHTGK